MKYPCPCCGSCVYPYPPDGNYDICENCGWEDDPVQMADPSYSGGANHVSLNEAKDNWEKYGSIEGKNRKAEEGDLN